MKLTTLCFLIKENQILLAMKKRGFGQGRWNGVGGKQQPNETILETAIRETQEEIGVFPKSLKQSATLNFYLSLQPEWNNKCTVYICDDWEGEPQESEEMKPQWFNIDNIPYNSMWPDDIIWLPKLLNNEKFTAEFLFGENDIILDYKINETKYPQKRS